MSFSFLGGLASLLPGYFQGQRMANQDNWQDLMNYNNVQAGQQANAFTEATWQPRLNMMRNSWMDSTFNTLGNMLLARQALLQQPYEEWRRSALSYYGPQLGGYDALAQLRLGQMAFTNPMGLGAVVGGNANTGSSPSVAR